MICTFFGHRDAPSKMEGTIRETIERLISEGVTCFYVGNNGNFDSMVHRQLKQLSGEYPHIKYYVVLAYMPTEQSEFDVTDYTETIYPEGLESVPPRFAISKRNQWMVEKADIVVTYVKYSTGGAAHAKKLAVRKGKTIVDIT